MSDRQRREPSSAAALGVLLVGIVLLVWAVVEAIASSPNAGRFGAATGFVLVGGLLTVLGSKRRGER